MDDDRMSLSSGVSSDIYGDTGNAAELFSSTDATAGAQSDRLTPKHGLDDVDDTHLNKRIRVESDEEALLSDSLPTSSAHLPDSPPASSAHLPVEVWQSVFSHLPPPELFRMMRVNKCLKSYLDGTYIKNRPSEAGSLRILDVESLLARWRTLHVPNMPKPLESHSELEMWRLIRGIRCEFCGKVDEQPRRPIPVDVWHGGPSMSTTRVIWPFASRSCGECLFKSCEKDTKLLCTPFKSLLAGLPYAFFTHDWQYVPTTVVSEAASVPPSLHMSKQFLRPHCDQILAHWERVKAHGKGSAEEYLKGLPGQGKHTMTDVARWERWETKGGLNGLHFLLSPPPPQVMPVAHPSIAQQTSPQPWGPHQFGWPPTNSQPQFFQPQPVSMAQNPVHHISAMAAPQHYFPTSPASVQNPFSQPNPVSTPHGQTPGAFGQLAPNPPPTQTPGHRVERNARDATEGKNARRKAIVERCLSDPGIDPPLLENVLRHMESFQAATQISAPLTDNAWEVLKPRLLAQRPAAEQMEREHTAQLLALQAQVDAQNKRNVYSKEAKDAQEREWDEALKPQRVKLSSYADDYVQQHWRGGHSVNSGNVALFAISVINHVRKQFYSELEAHERLAVTAGHHIRTDPPDGPFLRRLTLETMKWVYDHKIRPLTREYGKEVFFCSGDGCEQNGKIYAFEGAIQHYGAKHTNNFSKGNVIVHWQTADWPEDLPFFDPGTGPTRHSHHVNGGFLRGATITPQVTSNAPFNVPSLTTSPYTPLSGYGQGPFPPPVNAASGFSPQGHSIHHRNGSTNSFGPASQSATQSFDPKDLSQYFTKGLLTNLPSPNTATPATGVTPFTAPLAELLKSLGTQPTSQAAPPGPVEEAPMPSGQRQTLLDTDVPDFAVYQDQLKSIADTARSTWNSLPAILAIPQSVRVFAVIHRTVSQFLSQFGVNLSLETFTAALTNNPLLEPVKNADDLSCHLCELQMPMGTPPSRLDRPTQLSHLISHFKAVHIDGATPPSDQQRVKWATNLISLPPDEFFWGLVSAPGITDERLAILSEAFPDLLPRRLPRHKETDFRPKQKNNRRFTRKFSNRRQCSEDPMDVAQEPNFSNREEAQNQPNGDDSGYRGFTRYSRSPPGLNGRRRTPKLYDDKRGDEYDPSRPALLVESGGGDRRRDIRRKRSGHEPDLATLIKSATADAQRAAEEENARRGIVLDSHSRPESTWKPGYEPPLESQHGRPLPPNGLDEPQHRLHYARSVSREPDRRAILHAETFHTDYPIDSELGHVLPEEYYPETPAPQHRIPQEYHEGTYLSEEPIVRARSSRYARYDEQSRLLRDRSRSPSRFEEPVYVDQRAYRQQREQPPPPPPPPPVPARRSPVQHGYPDEREVIMIDEYGRRVQYVRIRDDPGPRYTQRPEEEMVEYIDRRPAYDERQYRYYDDDRAAYLEHDLRYEPRPLPMHSQSVPARDARYVD